MCVTTYQGDGKIHVFVSNARSFDSGCSLRCGSVVVVDVRSPLPPNNEMAVSATR